MLIPDKFDFRSAVTKSINPNCKDAQQLVQLKIGNDVIAMMITVAFLVFFNFIDNGRIY